MKTNDMRSIIWKIAAMIAAYHCILHVADIVRYALFMPLKEIWLLFMSPVLLAIIVAVSFKQSAHYGRIANAETSQSGVTDLGALQFLLIKVIGIFIISTRIPMIVEALCYIMTEDINAHHESVRSLIVQFSRPIVGFLVGCVLVFRTGFVSRLLSWSDRSHSDERTIVSAS